VAKTSGAASTANPAAPPPAEVSATKGNGSEELTIAESYLNGTQGRASDNAEAAKWLWRSVAKQNSSAALMLSDLYLKGTGVAKNCDQARMLLDIATRKGAAGAANRLRNLQAFGCQ
jgi:localization factor PodJL